VNSQSISVPFGLVISQKKEHSSTPEGNGMALACKQQAAGDADTQGQESAAPVTKPQLHAQGSATAGSLAVAGRKENKGSNGPLQQQRNLHRILKQT
jgi:hypothetical protein